MDKKQENLNLINNFIEYLKVEKRCSLHTLVAYQTDLSQFNNFLLKTYDLLVIDLKFTLARSFLVELISQNISNISIARKLTTIKSFYKFLIKEQIIDFSPVVNLQAPKTEKRLPQFIKQSDMFKLYDRRCFSNDFLGLRDYMIINLFYKTGIRLSEMINLKEDDVSKREIKVTGKRNKQRIIPISNALKEEINDYIKLKKDNLILSNNYLFVTNKGNKMYEKFVYRKVNHYLGAVSSQNKTSPHILRHTFATHMLNNGADLNAIKEILGHESLSATQIYTHNSFKKLKNIHKQAHPRG